MNVSGDNLLDVRVLVWPYSTEIGLEIIDSLQNCKEFVVIGAGISTEELGCLSCEGVEVLPIVTECDVSDLNEVIVRQKIDVVFPAHDDVVVFLAMNQKSILCKTLCPSVELADLLRDKKSTYVHLLGVVPTPKLIDFVDSETELPMFTKPRVGQGSVGARIVGSHLDALSILQDRALLLMEYLPGKEFTVDCFSDSNGNLMYASPRVRLKQRNGIAVITEAIENSDSVDLARKIANSLALSGVWFFQCRYSSEGILTILEVSNRVAGSMTVSRLRGVNLPALWIFQVFECQLVIQPLEIYPRLERTLSRRQLNPIVPDCVLVDFDDTLIVRNILNTRLIATLAVLKAKGSLIKLVSRHKGNLSSTVNANNIAWIFDEMIHLTGGEPKHSCIVSDKTILIDDSFRERSDFMANTSRMAIDSSMIGIFGT